MDTTLQDPLVGHVLDGRYQVESRIARGGMATVYLALDRRLDRMVALKVMHPELAEDPEFVSRFIREAKTAARLSHPNVVAVYDQGADGGHVFLAMEYVEGRTLRDVMRKRARLTPAEAFTVLEPVLAALGAAHAAGLVHRDVKPENVLLADDGRVKVADFGLVHAVSSTTSTTAGNLLGTVSYLAPEQVQRGVADPRSDVYASGILLYEMLTGEKPHDGENPIHVVYRHVHEDVPPPSLRVPDIPPTVDALVVSATARDPDLRPVDAAQLLAELRAVRRGLSAEQLAAGGSGGFGGVGSGVGSGLDAGPAGVGEPASGQLRHHDTIAVPVPVSIAGSAGETAGVAGRPSGPGPRVRGPGDSHGWVGLAVVLAFAVLVSVAAWWIGAGRYVRAPAVLSMNQQQASQAIAAAGLHPKWKYAFSEVVAKGLVVQTKPKPNGRIVRGGTMTVFLSQGPDRVAVPSLAGRSLDDARDALRDNRLELAGTQEKYSKKYEQDEVIDVRPDPGTRVKPHSAVFLVVSKGPPPVDVPNVVGRGVQAAKNRLERAGLSGEVVGEVFSDTVPKGQVAEQDPGGDRTADAGSTVRLRVSKGPELVEVPKVTGLKVQDAIDVLDRAGFGHRVLSVPAGPNRVLAQVPGAGSMRPRGTRVTLSVF